MSNQELMNKIVDNAVQANQLDAQTQRMVVTMFRLLAEGQPVSAARFADAMQIPVEVVRKIIATVPAEALDRDDDGNVVAFSGLTLEETDHRMEIDGKVLYGWCAFDTLFLSALLGKSAEITSKEPESGETIQFKFGPGGYEGSSEVVMSLLDAPPEEMRNNVRAAFCHNVHFFANSDSAARYAQDHADLAVVPISDAVALAGLWNERIYGDALDG